MLLHEKRIMKKIIKTNISANNLKSYILTLF